MKRVLITGAASGFGRAMVSALLARGHHVFATFRDLPARTALFQDESAVHGSRLTLLELDVSSAADRERAVQAAEGRLDALVNNAGYALFGALEDLSETQLRAQWEVNFISAALLTQALLPSLRAASGAVINVSSVFGFAGFPLTTAYCASKYALEGLSEALYHELRPHGVRVHLVEPGGHRTGFSAAVAWGEGRVPAYQAQTQAYHQLKEGLSQRGGRGPEEVATRVARLIERPSRRLRIPVGPDALAAKALKALPDLLHAKLSAWLYDRMLPSEGGS